MKTLLWRVSAVMYPAFVRAPLRASSCALRQLALLLRLRRPAGYGFAPNLVRKEGRKYFSVPSVNADLRHLEAWHTRSMCPDQDREIQQTETIMYQKKVTLIGFLGSNAEVRTNNNRSFTTLSLATKSSYKKDDKYISHTEWHRCIVFGKLSEFAKTLTKGAHIQVEGELRSREDESKKTDSKQRVWEIRVASILKLDRAEKAAPEDQEKDQENDEMPQEDAAA